MTRLDGSVTEPRQLDRALGRTLQAARIRRGLTQENLSSLAGVSRRHIAAIEGGANCSVAILLDLARSLAGATLQVGEFLLVPLPGVIAD